MFSAAPMPPDLEVSLFIGVLFVLAVGVVIAVRILSSRYKKKDRNDMSIRPK